MGDFLHVVFNAPPPRPTGRELWAVGSSRWARIVAPIMQQAIRDKAPIGQGDSATGRKPGALKASITVRTVTAAGSVQLKAGSTVPYAAFVRDGTRPHTIVPASKKSLRFLLYGHAPGALVFATRVAHPGTRANHFAKRGLAPRIPEIQETFSAVMRETYGGAA